MSEAASETMSVFSEAYLSQVARSAEEVPITLPSLYNRNLSTNRAGVIVSVDVT